MTSLSSSKVAPTNLDEMYGATVATTFSLDDKQMKCLLDQGFTRGLADSLNSMRRVFPLRIWVVDNSGSMKAKDGHRTNLQSSNSEQEVRMAACTRWDEICDCVNYHINLAALLDAPTRFRLLNKPSSGPQHFSVADNLNSFDKGVEDALSIMRDATPEGRTPLSSHIREIHQEVSRMANDLRKAGERVVIVIATDGLPTDTNKQGFVETLRLLEGLPVWVVIRLCTDEDDVVSFYNDLDGQLELSIEVLDDFCGEAQEVYGENPWLNYALPLHRLREMGYHDRVFDMLDERALTNTELRDFCALLFGEENIDGMPDPSLDWEGFISDVERLVKREREHWNPILKRRTPWINTKRLRATNVACRGCMIM